MKYRWSSLPLGAKIGAIALGLPFFVGSPFLIYLGLAFMNMIATWARPAGHPVEVAAGVLALAIYVVTVFGLPLVIGGLLGLAVERALGKVQRRGA